MTSADYRFENDAKQQVYVHVWLPPGPCRGIVVVSHGMSEHGGRYARFAEALTKNGYAVYAPDHRGHGLTADGHLGIGGPDAWNGTIRDLEAIADNAVHDHPGVPLFLFGHSMGSIAAQRFIELHGAMLRGVVLSGTTSDLPGADQILPAVRAQAQAAPDEMSPLAPMMFASFNQAFEPVKTPFDWLSRDAAEVQKYIDDPLCGFPFTSGLLADHLTGWVEVWKPEHEAAIPKTLSVLSVAGALDPVGGAGTAVSALSARYAAHGIEHIQTVLYPEARHEILNETNRDDVTVDIIDWLVALT